MKKIVSAQWNTSLDENISIHLREWLLDAGSFMQRLKQYKMDARIQVLQQGWQLPHPQESLLLSIGARTEAWVREVMIGSENNQWMYARSVFPRHLLTGKQKEFLSLEDRALGSILFSDPAIQRSGFEFACLRPGMWLYDKKPPEVGGVDLWARRSLFSTQKKSLLLVEVFMPDILTIPEAFQF